MDFELTESQCLLKDSVDRVMSKAYGDFRLRSEYRSEPVGWSEMLWAQYADMGLLRAPFAECDGGLGGSTIESMVIMEAIGRWMVVEPYLATIILSGTLLRLGGTPAQRQRYVPKIMDGSLRLAFAHSEPQARYDLYDVAATARSDGAEFELRGAKSAVIHGDSANFLIVSARTSGARRDRTGISLFLVDRDSPGLSVVGYGTQDGLRAADLTLEAVRVGPDAVIGRIDHAFPLIERAVDAGISALASEAVGAMEALHSLTVEYLKTRMQFGVRIGSFQALQHRAVDMLLALEQARSMAFYAAAMVDETDSDVRRAALSAVKLQINDSARAIGQGAMQLHGGIAMTDLYKAGHYFKRLTVIEGLLGDSAHHLRLLSAPESGSFIG